MQFLKNGPKVWIRLDRGEDFFQSLLDLAKKENWKSGVFTGLGALEDLTLGFYHLDQKEYERKHFPDEYELINVTGNLSTLEGEPFLHAHVVIGDSQFHCFGGHLFSAKVAVTCELDFTLFPDEVRRERNETVGLHLLRLCPKQG